MISEPCRESDSKSVRDGADLIEIAGVKFDDFVTDDDGDDQIDQPRRPRGSGRRNRRGS